MRDRNAVLVRVNRLLSSGKPDDYRKAIALKVRHRIGSDELSDLALVGQAVMLASGEPPF